MENAPRVVVLHAKKKILLLSNKTQEFFDDKLASKHQNLHFKKRRKMFASIVDGSMLEIASNT